MRTENRWIKSCLRVLLLCLCFFVFGQNARAKEQPLDEIERESIWLETRDDGSLDITYEIDWKVLDDTSEGPLEWVKIGIPNEYVEEITPLSDSIDEISYYVDDGEYVRIDLDREYREGESVRMKFSIHQHQMYQNDKDAYRYTFTPGWFDEMEIKEMAIAWKAEKGTLSSMEETSLNGKKWYVERFSNLKPGEKISIKMEYPKNQYAFCDDYNKRAREGSQADMVMTIVMFVGCMAVLPLTAVVMYAFRKKWFQKDNYERHSGLGTAYVKRSGTYYGRGRSGGGGCACACACAGAGGGRAGCSRKDFYYRRMIQKGFEQCDAKGLKQRFDNLEEK